MLSIQQMEPDDIYSTNGTDAIKKILLIAIRYSMLPSLALRHQIVQVSKAPYRDRPSCWWLPAQ